MAAVDYISQANVQIIVQQGTDRTVYANFGFHDPSWVSYYKYRWEYTTEEQDVWFKVSDKDEKTSNAYTEPYSAPSNSTRVRIHVYYYPNKHKVKGKKVNYFTAGWKKWVEYTFVTPLTPAVPPVPTVDTEGFTLTAENNPYDENTDAIEFEVVKNDESVFATGRSSVVTNHAAFSCSINAGDNYKVRARGLRTNDDTVLEYGNWSEYSSNVGTIPSTPTAITEYKVLTTTSLSLTWEEVPNADSYTAEYTTDVTYFDTSNETQTQTVEDNNTMIIIGLDTGITWYFRIKATNEKGDSGWTEPISVVMGKVPAAPTTWSETSTAKVGDTVHLYWVHNAQDGSKETFAQIELTINGTTTVETIQNESEDDDEITTSEYAFNTTSYTEGTTLNWRVRTKGVIDEYGPWSTQRTVKIYAPATISFGSGSNIPSTFTTFPIVLQLVAGPNTQNAVTYGVTIKSTETYQTVNNIGEDTIVSAGDVIFSKNYNAQTNTLLVVINAGDIDLEDGVTFTITATVAMDSGLTASINRNFTVSWSSLNYYLDAEIGIDEDSVSAYIRPYALDSNNNTVSGLNLAVYRREFDGGFTEIASGIDSTSGITVTDPHPALDYARYRIVATSRSTGQVGAYDLPEYPINDPNIILQWDQIWRNFGTNEYVEDDSDQPTWSGSMLKLKYNVDVQDKYSPDVTFASYIGRANPVSYYGTQNGVTSSWKTDIPAYDTETIYALRRLAAFKGDVYVREPSGTGYWAHVTPSFSLTHNAVIIPVTLDIKRVEGGV